jgi:hypothetical protein
MNENERELMEGLRALGTLEPREAPGRVEQRLLTEFRARARRRRLTLWVSAAAGMAAAAASIAVTIWMPSEQQKPVPPTVTRTAPADTPKSVEQPVETALSPEPAVRYAVLRTDEVAASFYPTPDADALAPLESAMVVRVQLPLSSLRLMGLPVSEDPSGDPVQAEVLLGQDGLARGVRLVQNSFWRE